MPLPIQARRFLRIDSVLGENALIISRADGHEAMGRLFEIRIEFTSAKDDLDFDELLGSPALLRLDMADSRSKAARANQRLFHGHFSRIVHAGFNPEGRPLFRATLVPWLWFLTRTSDCRIFQGKTVREIIEEVFSSAGFSDYRFKLRGNYPTIDYCVQYRETDFQFVSRLLEREGIYYHFKHKEDSHIMVICDDLSCHKPAKNFETLSFIGGGAVTDREGVISSWEVSREIKPGAYAHNDYNFLSPAPDPNLRLLSRSSAPEAQKPGPLEIYDNPGGFADTKQGERYARIRMEELLADRDVATARTNIQGVEAGRTFKLAKHPTRRHNRGYLVTAVQWSAQEGAYGSGSADSEEFFTCGFTCIPDDRPFRPARITPLPRIEGPQTATVVGPKGEEIHVDEHARVKVQFHWDRYGKSDAGSSCWIRVSQPWAGAGFGGMSIPRIGQEVIVECIEADPDRPIITGRVYNGKNMPNASNAGRDGKPGNSAPKDMTQAAMMTSMKSNSLGGSGGSNEITMNDAGGSEGLFIKAQKDEIHNVGNDLEVTIGNNETKSVGVDQALQVGNNQTESIGTNATETVGNAKVVDVGNTLLIKAGTSITLQCGASTIHMNQAGFITISGTVISVAAAVNASVVAPLTEIVGAAMLAEAGGLIKIYGGTTHVGAAGLTKISGSTVASEAKGDHITTGAKVASAASGENIVQGATVKLN